VRARFEDVAVALKEIADDNFALIACVSDSLKEASDCAAGTSRRVHFRNTAIVEYFLREDDGSCRLSSRGSEMILY